MSDGLHINSRPLPIYGNSTYNTPQSKITGNEESFSKIVESIRSEKDDGVKISSHAQKRILSRKIEIDEKLMKNLDNVLEIAERKGAKSTLAMLGENSFILSVRDRTVVTVVDNKDMESRFFTNIDSVYVEEQVEINKTEKQAGPE